MARFLLPLVVLLSACEQDNSTDKVNDIDGDGLSGAEDCDDTDASVGGVTPWTVDGDGDGFGSTVPLEACARPDNTVEVGGDCDDTNSAVSPAQVEVCDGVDNDCSGVVDDGVGEPWYADADGDGFGVAGAVVACEQPVGMVSNHLDCDDGNDQIYPDARELCNDVDDDCDGLIDNGTADDLEWHADLDGDGSGDPGDVIISCHQPEGRIEDAGDCDDGNALVNPAAAERCNTIDDDCDGEIDEADAVDPSVWYADVDVDGYGDDAVSVLSCEKPTGYVALGEDCDDTDSLYNPGASELDCTDPNDYNCDGSTGYADADADGWAACAECDDTSAANFPGATEVCDSVDNDCDGTVDEADAVDAITWYADADADLYGDPATSSVSCSAPLGYVVDGSDCDDTDSAVNPAAVEVCNTLDDDCDGAIDEDSAADASDWYLDDDGDGYGDGSTPTRACDAPTDYVADATDCDDGRRLTHPGATEYCNTEDDDCDGVIDDAAADARTYWEDADADTYGNVAVSVDSCSTPLGYVRDDDDCDDADAAVNPAATETCNAIDDDCDGSVDEGISVLTWYDDDDGDGYGGASDSGCTAPVGSVDNGYDCDDTDAAVYPGSAAACPWSSCLDLLADGIATTTDEYWIDFAGTATFTTCDMDYDGGGWTLLFEDDMTAADPTWSTTTTYSCGAWGTILGGYGIIAGGTMDIDLSTYAITHTESWVELVYVALDSWDGETAYVQVDGSTLWSTAVNNHSSSYSEVCGWNRGSNGSYDSRHDVDETAAHSSGTLNFAAGSTLNQGPTDESFGIDDVYVWIR